MARKVAVALVEGDGMSEPETGGWIARLEAFSEAAKAKQAAIYQEFLEKTAIDVPALLAHVRKLEQDAGAYREAIHQLEARVEDEARRGNHAVARLMADAREAEKEHRRLAEYCVTFHPKIRPTTGAAAALYPGSYFVWHNDEFMGIVESAEAAIHVAAGWDGPESQHDPAPQQPDQDHDQDHDQQQVDQRTADRDHEGPEQPEQD